MSLISPDSGLLIWMTLIFAVVFFILAKFGFPLITGMVDKRAERINESLRKAEEAEQRLSGLAAEQEALLEKTRQEQVRILAEADRQKDQIVALAREQAEQEAAKVMDSAREQIARERDAAVRDIRSKVSLLSVELAGKVIRKNLSDDASQLELLDKMAEEASHTHLN